MTEQTKKIITWIITITAGILLICLAFFAISIIPAIILSPAIIYDLIREPESWSELSLYYKIVIISGSLVLAGIVVKELIGLVIWIKNKLK